MNSTVRNVLLAGAVIASGIGLSAAAVQTAKPPSKPAAAPQNQPHRHGQSRFFAEYDQNHDGKITKDEFNKVVAQHFQQAGGGKPLTQGQFSANRLKSLQQHGDQMFHRADWNGDGKLSFDEFANPIRAGFARADRQSAGFINCRAQGANAGNKASAGHGRGGHRGAGSFCARDDLNHDGKVTRAELDQALHKQFADAAKGGNALNRDQYMAMQQDRSRQNSGRGFSHMDLDHNGTVTLQEYAQSEQHIFARVDKNNDGVITRDEANSSRRRGPGHSG